MTGEKNHQGKVEDPVLVRGRKGRTHITRCGRGYTSPSYIFKEIHHVLCIHCVTDATISEQLNDDDENVQRIKDCLDLTNWNINDSHNTVGLPKKRAFYRYPSSDWGGWPCHQVDHNVNGGYTEKVSDYLGTNIWKPALEVAEDCEFDAKALEEALKSCSDYWYGMLEGRGSMNKGTAFCWDNRFGIENGEFKNDPEVTEPWYFPFSMHPGTPTERKPPPDEDEFTKQFKEMLSATFGR
jgi:hypothetical protein